MAQATTLFDASDKPVFTIFKEQRIEVPLSRVSQNLIKAVVSVEDTRFFDHGGIDAVRVIAAVVRKLRKGGVPRGAAPSRSSSPVRASSTATRRSAAS